MKWKCVTISGQMSAPGSHFNYKHCISILSWAHAAHTRSAQQINVLLRLCKRSNQWFGIFDFSLYGGREKWTSSLPLYLSPTNMHIFWLCRTLYFTAIGWCNTTHTMQPSVVYFWKLVFSSDCLECGPLEYQSFHNCTYECRYKLNANHSGGLFTFC